MDVIDGRLTSALLAEWEQHTGYLWCRDAGPAVVRLPNRHPGTLLRAARTLARWEHDPVQVPMSLRRRTTPFHAWAAEHVGQFAVAARLQKALGNAKEAQWLACQGEVAQQLGPLLPRGASVRALQLWDPHKRIWAALSFTKWTPALHIVQKTTFGWHQLDRHAIGERAENAHIVVKAGELLLVEQEDGSSRQPEDITCFQLRQGKLEQTFTATGDHGIGVVYRQGRWNLLISVHPDQVYIYAQSAHGWHHVTDSGKRCTLTNK